MVVSDDLLKCLILLGFSFRFPFVIKLNSNATLLFVIVYFALNHGFLEGKHEGHGGPHVLASMLEASGKILYTFFYLHQGQFHVMGFSQTPFGFFLAFIYSLCVNWMGGQGERDRRICSNTLIYKKQPNRRASIHHLNNSL